MALGLSLGNSVLSYLNGILVARFAINRHTNLLAKHLELLDGCRTVNVASHKQRRALDEAVGQLAREGGLTRTLKTRHQDNGGMALDVERSLLTTHELGELIVHNLNHQLLRLQGIDNVLTYCFLFNSIGERLSHLIVNVGLNKSATNLF